jgi:hypothetical protein
MDLAKDPASASARDRSHLSWFGLALFYGFGYCPSTDWHWQVKRARGETGLPNSYVKYYLDRLTGLNWDHRLVDSTVLLFGLAALGLSIALNWRDWRRSVRVEEGNSLNEI